MSTLQARDVTSRCPLLIWHYFNTLILIGSHLHALLERIRLLGVASRPLFQLYFFPFWKSQRCLVGSGWVFFFGGAYKTRKTKERAMEKDSARPISLKRCVSWAPPLIWARDGFKLRIIMDFKVYSDQNGPERTCAVVGLISGLVLEAQYTPKHATWVTRVWLVIILGALFFPFIYKTCSGIDLGRDEFLDLVKSIWVNF